MGYPLRPKQKGGFLRGITWDFRKYGGLCPGTPEGEGQESNLGGVFRGGHKTRQRDLFLPRTVPTRAVSETPKDSI